jgi:dTDP-4-amino-4,6-dideoxygalactose transaminase
VVLPHEVPGSRHVWHQYVIRTPRRDALREFLAMRQIGSEIYYPVPLHLQAALKGLGCAEGSFPEAERAAREVLALPIFPELREDEQRTVAAAIAEFLS